MSGVFDDHLGLDAVVAYVDGELGLTAFQRAAAHVLRCPQCASEVAEQEAVARCLRSAELPRMPGSLFDALASIPLAVPRRDPVPPADRFPGGGPTAPADRLPGGSSTAADRFPMSPAVGLGVDPAAFPATRASGGRRFRLGAGALVAGLAVGAVVAAAPTHPRPVAPRPRGSEQLANTTLTPDAVAVPAGLRR